MEEKERIAVEGEEMMAAVLGYLADSWSSAWNLYWPLSFPFPFWVSPVCSLCRCEQMLS